MQGDTSRTCLSHENFADVPKIAIWMGTIVDNPWIVEFDFETNPAAKKQVVSRRKQSRRNGMRMPGVFEIGGGFPVVVSAHGDSMQ